MYSKIAEARTFPDGTGIAWGNPYEYLVRWRTEAQVPVPSVRDALGQHVTARVLRRAGFPHLPSYHPERRSTP